VTVALTTYAYFALRLWWEENGEDVKEWVKTNWPVFKDRLAQFIEFVRQAAVATYEAGQYTALLMNRGTDALYFYAIDL
jgi:uncharacterized protein YaeQ